MANWDRMISTWYETVGYDPETGRPWPGTLEQLGLGDLVPEVWPDMAKETPHA